MFNTISTKTTPRLVKLLARTLVIALFGLCSTAVNASYLGLISGQEATPEKTSTFSAELGIVTGELAERDYQNIALRLNYRYSPQTVISGTIGVGEFAESDGVPIGLGVLYHLSKQRISDAVEIAGKASVHLGEYTLGDTNVDGDIAALALEVVVSGAKPLMHNGMAWYSTFGFQHLSIDVVQDNSESELGLGAGLVLPTGLGNAYLGFEYYDSLTIGLGIRYFVQ